MHMQLSRVVAGIALAGLVGGLATAAPATSSEVPGEGRPNVVIIMTDDMRADDLEYMPHTRELLGQLELTDFVSNHPLCCPARAELITGQHGHNNGVHHNGGPFGEYRALIDKDNTLGTWFDDAGYETSIVGKFMNGWRPDLGTLRQRGWDNLDVIFGDNAYTAYNYEVFQEAGPATRPGVYTNDFVAAQSVARVTEAAAAGDPFLLWSSYVAPHGMRGDDGKWKSAIPAPRHEDLFAGLRPPLRSKPNWVGVRGKKLPEPWRDRIRSLQSVDEGVRDLVEAAKAAGVHDNTVYVFTSDNGYLLGEHGVWGKNLPYEEALRVPLLAAGPGVDSGTSAKGAMMADIAPSLSALAGIEPGRPQDGRSDLFTLDGGWRETLIQGGRTHDTHPWWWRGVRARKWVYIRWTDRPAMLFHRRKDPYQLRNLAFKRPAVEKRMRTSLPEVQSMRKTRSTRINTARAAEPWG